MSWKTVLGSLFGLLCLVAIVVYLMGLMLPVAHTASMTDTINAPQEKVWSMIVDLKGQPRWRSGVESVEELPAVDGKLRWRERMKGEAITFEAVDTVEPKLRVVKLVDEGLPYGGTWTYRLEPLDAGSTKVTITEEGIVGRPVFRFFMHYVFGETTTIKTYLKDLKAGAAS